MTITERESKFALASPGRGHLGTFAVKPTNTAAFVTKLYTMVDDSTEDLIGWSDVGDHFKVISPSSFACSVLPRYFKHRNWTSFVRQLNMYGFHKVSEYRDEAEQDIWCFKHASFYRGGRQSSHLIRRKRSHTSPRMEQMSPAAGEDADDEESTSDMDLDPKLERVEAALTNMHQHTQTMTEEIRGLWSAVKRQQEMTVFVVDMLANMVQRIQSGEKAEERKAGHDCQQRVYDPVWDRMRCDCDGNEGNRAARSINTEADGVGPAKRACAAAGEAASKKAKVGRRG